MPVTDAHYPTGKASYEKGIEISGDTERLYRIYRAEVKQLKVWCVIKIVDLEKPNPSGGTSDTLSDVQKEVAVMRGCSHENIVQLYTSFAVESEVRVFVRHRQGSPVRTLVFRCHCTQFCGHECMCMHTSA